MRTLYPRLRPTTTLNGAPGLAWSMCEVAGSTCGESGGRRPSTSCLIARCDTTGCDTPYEYMTNSSTKSSWLRCSAASIVRVPLGHVPERYKIVQVSRCWSYPTAVEDWCHQHQSSSACFSRDEPGLRVQMVGCHRHGASLHHHWNQWPDCSPGSTRYAASTTC